MSASPPKDGEAAGENSPANSSPSDMNPPVPPESYEFDVKEQDRWLPIANVARIMKSALPDNAKIAKEAKECMQECVSEFISFITSEASEKCQQEKRKTVNGEDILFAMTSTGFENYAEALKIYLGKYRECNETSELSHKTRKVDQVKSQTQRGDNQGSQQRPGSSYGNQPQSATSTQAPGGFHGQDDQILSPQGLDPTQQDPGYGGVYPQGATNNGVGGDHY